MPRDFSSVTSDKKSISNPKKIATKNASQAAINLKERVSYLFILLAILTEHLPYAWKCVRCWEYKDEQDVVITI